MQNFNGFVFKALHVVAWIIFVALSVEAGGLLVNFFFSLFKPEVVGHLYQKLDLSQMYQQSKIVFFGMYSFVIFIAILKAFLFYIVIQLLTKLDLKKPFSSFVANKITRISHFTFYIGILSYIAQQTAKSLTHHGFEINKLNQFWVDSQAFILMAALIYVIASIFNRGIEIQTENELTV